MAVVTAFESVPTNPPYPQLPFIGPPLYSLYDPMGPEPNVSREQLMALEVDMRRAHALAQPAARARAAYKRLARRGGPAESIPAALRKATELSTERYELLHANARHARALLEDGAVTVNGEDETRRGRQLVRGDVVEVDLPTGYKEATVG